MKTSRTLFFLVAMVVVSLPASGAWRVVQSGLDSWGVSTAVYDGGLVVGGYFGNPGDVMAPAVVRWDGTNWTPLGSGIPQGYPSALLVYDGKLIAGGSFDQVGSALHAHHVGQWDGSGWAPMGAGLDGSVFAFAVFEDKLIAGGNFTMAGGQSCAGIALWDGSSWSPLGAGVDGYVGALAVYNGRLVAGGRFAHAGGIEASNIAQWDGTSWSPLGSGIANPLSLEAWGPAVWALAVYDGKLIAGGTFPIAGEVAAKNVAQWDGASWSALGLGISGGTVLDGAVGSLTVYEGELIAGGLFERAGADWANNIARWDGQAWSPLENGTNSGVLGLAVLDGSLIAVGAFDKVDDRETGYLGVWDNQKEGLSLLGSGSNAGSRHSPPASGGTNPMADAVHLAAYDAGGNSSPPSLVRLYTTGRVMALELKTPGHVAIDVFTLGGARVRRVVDESVGAGKWQFWWDGLDDRGRTMGAGVYFLRLATAGGAAVAKIVYVK